MQTERAEGNVHLKTTAICHYVLRNKSLAKKLSDKEGTKTKLPLAWRTKVEGVWPTTHFVLVCRVCVTAHLAVKKKKSLCPFKDFTASSSTHVMGSLSLFHTAV